MKAMLWSDVLVVRKYLLQQIIIAPIIALFICIATKNLYVGLPIASVMIPLSLAFTLIALDERGKWEQFRLALPLSRNEVIFGRYVSLMILVLIGFVLGALILGLVAALATLMPTVAQLGELLANFSWQAVGFTSVISILLVLMLFSVTLPLVSRFGMTKAVRLVPLLITLGIALFFIFGGNSDMPAFVADLLALLETPEGTIGLGGILVATGLTLYALSCALSVKLYARREL